MTISGLTKSTIKKQDEPKSWEVQRDLIHHKLNQLKTQREKSRLGRKPLDIDLERLEELAELGLINIHIAESLGISEKTFYVRLGEDNSQFSQAYKTGRSAWREAVAVSINVQSVFNPIVNIFRAKNALDWKDQRTVDTTGKIEVLVTHQVLAPVEPAKVIEFVMDQVSLDFP